MVAAPLPLRKDPQRTGGQQGLQFHTRRARCLDQWWGRGSPTKVPSECAMTLPAQGRNATTRPSPQMPQSRHAWHCPCPCPPGAQAHVQTKDSSGCWVERPGTQGVGKQSAGSPSQGGQEGRVVAPSPQSVSSSHCTALTTRTSKDQSMETFKIATASTGPSDQWHRSHTHEAGPAPGSEGKGCLASSHSRAGFPVRP